MINISGLNFIINDRVLEQIRWKLVADVMHRHHGTHHYGNATVKKKYLEVRSRSLERGRVEYVG
jgi:hypothetical protein